MARALLYLLMYTHLYSSTHACMYIDDEIHKSQIHLQYAPERLCGCCCTGEAKDPEVMSTLRTSVASFG